MSPDLALTFVPVKQQEKEAALIYLLNHVIPANDLSIIFVSTRHHVEYLQELLTLAGMNVTYIYGTLDMTARKIHLEKFKNGVSNILIVTDVAARGNL